MKGKCLDPGHSPDKRQKDMLIWSSHFINLLPYHLHTQCAQNKQLPSLQNTNRHFISNSNAGPKPQNFVVLVQVGLWFFASKNLCTYQDIFHSNITWGVVNSKKNVRNPLNPFRHFFGCQATFFSPIHFFLLMSNKNLSFLLSNIT